MAEPLPDFPSPEAQAAAEWAARLQHLFRHAGDHAAAQTLQQIIYHHRLAQLRQQAGEPHA